jgi:hypothetical protein
VEQYLVERVKALGGECRKVQWLGRKGAPDRLVLLPACTIWVELKAPGEKARPHQTREHERMRALGQCVVVIDSFEDVDSILGETPPAQLQPQIPGIVGLGKPAGRGGV